MDKLQRIFRGFWGTTPGDLDSVMSLLIPSIASGRISDATAHISKVKHSAQAYNPYYVKYYELTDKDLPDNSVAVIRLEGMLYSWESDWVMDCIDRIEANKNICGLVIAIDGPGGMISHLEGAAAAIRAMKKPTATVCTGMMASAHFWLGTCADRIYCATELCEIGSVGIITQVQDFSEYYKRLGIKVAEIYADQSDLKNHAYRLYAEKGDPSELKEKADKLCEIFCSQVAENLNIKYDPALPLFRGQTFFAADALRLGYIDQIAGVPEAVRWVLAKAITNQMK